MTSLAAANDTTRTQAVRWAVWTDKGVGTPEEHAQFREWLGQPGHAEAFDVACDAIDILGPYEDDDFSEIEALRSEALEYAPPKRNWWALAALAATVVGLAGGSVAYVRLLPAAHHSAGAEMAQAAKPGPVMAEAQALSGDAKSFATAVGEQRVVKLADGTQVTMNTGTQIAVDYTPGRRIVRLLRGEALFDVFHNARRPFSVVAGDRQVTALGTIFEVRVEHSDLHVTLLKGRVVVDQSNAETTGKPVAPPTFLSPGQQLVAKMGEPTQIQLVDPGRALLWRQSLVEFSDESLADAVTELNRYSTRPIVLADKQLAMLHISGVYHAGQPDEFADLVTKMLPVGARENKRGEIELYARADGEN